MRILLYALGAATLLGACSGPEPPVSQSAKQPAPARQPALTTPDPAACHAFLRATISLSIQDHYDVRSDGGAFFSRQPYSLDQRIADKLAPGLDSTTASAYFLDTPPAVIREFRRQVLQFDTAAQRRFVWRPELLGQFVFVGSTADTLSPNLARQVRFVTPARQEQIRQEIEEWNHGPQQDRFVSYASLPLFSADGRYVLIVRGQAQQSLGWDSIFIYERQAQGWKIIDSARLSTL
ncbi:hypothetical protein [Hymenobacter cellulosivorans]|uniref:Lipoprotein n=1 Tax=Hymenobacter cellulosivorans TaxID=2932249 RepID=A0ABY4FHD2_9BACT|nr:hypothetical protein [Hymenobacter cellulosivorans]UOQ55352.1 hypothetical protein MUN80_11485 [Hymenobacter cellulosivorans]